MFRNVVLTLNLLALTTVMGTANAQGPPKAQPQPKMQGELPAVKLDGEWTVVYAEMEGKPADNKDFSLVTIKNNVATCRHAGKARSWRLEFGPHNMIRCTEQIDAKAITAPTEDRAPDFKGTPHTHHGVYIASKEYFCVALNKGIDRRQLAAPTARTEGQNGPVQPVPAFGPGQEAHASHFVLILRRPGSPASK